jgi:glycosyltransferase involved in cell wall biosynthesis
MDNDRPSSRNGTHQIPCPKDQIRSFAEPGNQLQEDEIERARQILNLIAEDPHPSAAVSDHLEEILGLLPAILTANIRQASIEGRPELVHSLQDLLAEYQPHLVQAAEIGLNQDPWKAPPSSYFPRILFVGPEDENTILRQQFPIEALQSLGCETVSSREFPTQEVKDFDVVIISRPHLNQQYLQGMAVCRACSIPVILDIELDYKTIPLKHPDYEKLSLASKEAAQAFTTGLILADQIISPSRELVNQLRSEGYTAFYTPPGWNGQNPLWRKPSQPRHTINIGWMGPPGQLEDIAEIRRMLVRLMRQIPQTKLVIGSNPQAYHLFKNIPDNRKIYLPPSRKEDFPYSLGQIDILLVPLRKIPFNRSLPDRPLMEAGAKGIPFVASPIPSFLDWEKGGLFAAGQEEWYTQLHQLVLNPELRDQLGEQGRQKAADREITHLAPVYKDLIDLIRWSKSPQQQKADGENDASQKTTDHSQN